MFFGCRLWKRRDELMDAFAEVDLGIYEVDGR